MPARPADPLAAEKHLLGRWLTQARRRGLLAAVPPEAWHTLSCVLSFTCRDGERRFTPDQLALALAVPRAEAARRLEDLEKAQWQGQPLAAVLRNHAGEVTGASVSSADLLMGVNETGVAPGRPSHADMPANPADVSGDAAPALAAPEPSAADALRAELLALALLPDQAERLLTHFPAERVRRQIRWLPRRGARNPAAFLIKAVAHDWPEPKADAGEEDA